MCMKIATIAMPITAMRVQASGISKLLPDCTTCVVMRVVAACDQARSGSTGVTEVRIKT